MRIRQGNDFIFLWAIERNGEPEDFSNAVNIRLHFKNFDCVGEVKSFQIVDGNIVRVEVSPEWASRLGAYRLILSYEFEDQSYSDGDRKCVVDVLAFNIVPKTSEADDVTEMAKTTDIMIGLKGDKGDPFTYDDFTQQQLDDIQQPITDFVAVAEVAENQREVNEGERVDAEIIREQQEADRQTNTATAITNAENAITDVHTAKDDYYDVVKPEILQAIDDANEVVDKLEGAVSFTVKTRDEYNQITPKVADKIYVTKPTLLIPSAEEKQGFAFKGDDLIYPNYAAKENLVLHYDFNGMKNNDVTKGVARDLSGNGKDGALTGFGYIAGSGYQNGGLRFDGIDDHIQGGFTMNLTPEFTIEYIFKSFREEGYEFFMGNGYPISPTSGWSIQTIIIGSNGLGFRVFSTENVGFSIFSQIFPKNGNDYAIVVTYNGIYMKLFINGVLVNTREYQNMLVKPSSYNFKIGEMPYGGYRPKQNVKSARIYNVALTDSEVIKNYSIDKKRFNLIDNNPSPEALAITELGGTII